MSSLKLYNTLTKQIETFRPLNPNRVTMYVCGPTVYDNPHIGNGRSVVVYDLLYRVLIQKYSRESVIFVRNITDVDDKINQAAKLQKISIRELTNRVTEDFYKDVRALNCLSPTVEPRVTEHISEIIGRIIWFGYFLCFDKCGTCVRDVTHLNEYLANTRPDGALVAVRHIGQLFEEIYRFLIVLSIKLVEASQNVPPKDDLLK